MSKKQTSTKQKVINVALGEVVEDKQKALEAAFAQIEKKLGKEKIFRLGQRPKLDCEVIKTGSLGLDHALGVGGLPKGRIIEIFGSESSGKTTLSYHCIAECQKAGGIAAFVDAEQSVDPIYAQSLGVNIDDLFVSQPDSGEEALEIMEALVRSGAVDLLVLDSVAALVPRAEIDGDMGASHVGLQARLMSQALRKLGPLLSRSNTAAIFINQLREKVGVTYGNPETTPGGRALKFWSSVRLEVKKGQKITVGTDVIGHRTAVKVAKNKVAPPFKVAEFDVIFGKGISRSGEILDIAAQLEIIKKAGAWYNYKDERIGQGREKAKTYLEENPEVMAEIEEAVRTKVFSEDVQITISEEVAKENAAADGSETNTSGDVEKSIDISETDASTDAETTVDTSETNASNDAENAPEKTENNAEEEASK